MASEAVKVIVRCRPLNQREKDLKCKVIVSMDSATGQCNTINPNEQLAPPKSFTFDGAYYTDSTTEQIYNEIVFPLVECVTEGYNGTVFAYGQTGCGKSFSMQGVTTPACQRGIIPRAFEHIFEVIDTTEDTKFLVHASYLEIYNEEIRDLLGNDVKKKMDLKEHNETGLFVAGLSMHPVHNVQECEHVMELGWKNRSVGSTLMNAESSRSHSIFTVYMERMSTTTTDEEENSIRKGKLNLVDLAGSERQAKTGATGDRLKEATKINLSLSALGNVISALVDGKCKHIPYRDSKLTRLLQDSLGGNTKTLMVACLSPADNNYDETLSTLRYANRAKNIKNKPKVNEDPKDALLREYQEEIDRLKAMISQKPPEMHSPTLKTPRDDALYENIKREYDLKMQELVAKYEEEQESNAKLKNDMNRLKETFEQKIIDSHDEGRDQANELVNTTRGSPRTSIDGQGGNIAQMAKERLQALQEKMVGGEKAGDTELKEKRARRKRIAEKKISAISDALSKFDDDDQLLLKAYGDITEELRARTLLLKRAKKKITILEAEVSDLQSEFEQERTDYLETIRRQEQQVKLSSQIMEKIGPCIRRDCNYSNLDRIKNESVWDEDLQKWRLPELVVTRTKLPPPSGNIHPGARQPSTQEMSIYSLSVSPTSRTPIAPTDQEVTSPESSFSSNSSGDKLFEKLAKGAQENVAVNYFMPKRRQQLLQNHVNKVSANNGPMSSLNFGAVNKSMKAFSLRNGNLPENNFMGNGQAGVPSMMQPLVNMDVNRKASKSVPSTSNGKPTGSAGSSTSNGSLSAGETFRRPVRLESITSNNHFQ